MMSSNRATPAQMRRNCRTVAELLKALGHPDRLLICCLISERALSVGDLVKHSGVSQSLVSQFLASLKALGILEADRVGKQVFYRVADERLKKLLQTLESLYASGKP